MFFNFQPREGIYTVGDFMTTRERLHVVKPTTTVDEGTADALYVENVSIHSFFCLTFPFMHSTGDSR